MSKAKLPKDQRCHFLIGPMGSLFLPNVCDMWTQPTSDRSSLDEPNSLSYFMYGGIGFFCHGEIYHHSDSKCSAMVKHLVDIKEDNSRVCGVRFLKNSAIPLAMILTCDGTLIIHNCTTSENLIHFKKSELMNKLIKPNPEHSTELQGGDQHCNKKLKRNITQQINACLWPDPTTMFVGISLLREKTNCLIRLKIADMTDAEVRRTVVKTDLIESFEKLELNLGHYNGPICCMESVSIDEDKCLIAVAMDDGLIVITRYNLTEEKQASRIIKLARHNDQICSLSFHVNSPNKFPSGILASASRDGLVLVWDIENEFYFADYQASSTPNPNNREINWFALTFVTARMDANDGKQIRLAVSNPRNGLTVLGVPENARSKIRLKEIQMPGNKDNQHGKRSQSNVNEDRSQLRHHKLILNVSSDAATGMLMSTALDENIVFWNLEQNARSIEAVPKFLLPAMASSSRVHMLRHSPIREDMLACALGKAGIKFFRIGEKSAHNRFDMSASCGLVARKISKASLSPTSLSWHPSHEYRLAVGTLEGKVLRVDLTPRHADVVETHKGKGSEKLAAKRKAASSLASKGGDPFDVDYEPLDRSDQEMDIEAVDASNKQPGAEANGARTDGVYSLCWGPNPTCPRDLTRLAIYAVGGVSHRLSIYCSDKESEKLSDFLADCNDLSLPEAVDDASEVAWKASMDLMALGTRRGKIVIACYRLPNRPDKSRLFQRIAVIEGPMGDSYVQCLSWHPSTNLNDRNYYQLATSANESAGFVFDFRSDMLVRDIDSLLRIDDSVNGEDEQRDGHDYKQRDDSETESSQSDDDHHSQGHRGTPHKALFTITNYAHKLDAHSKAITDIVWNPHHANQLATSSFDRACLVWELSAPVSRAEGDSDEDDEGLQSLTGARVISKFSARDRLFTMEWSLVDEDLAYTSGHDSTIWAWRPSENPAIKQDGGH